MPERDSNGGHWKEQLVKSDPAGTAIGRRQLLKGAPSAAVLNALEMVIWRRHACWRAGRSLKPVGAASGQRVHRAPDMAYWGNARLRRAVLASFSARIGTKSRMRAPE